jgi:putative transposase
VAFSVDVCSRCVGGRQAAHSLRPDLALDALEMALRARGARCATELIHRSDRGVQYLAVRYTERLAAAGGAASVGSRGDAYDNTPAESFHCLCKAELIRHRGPWQGLDDGEFATLEYVDWFNYRRLHGELGMVPPSACEVRSSERTAAVPAAAS